MPLNPFYSWLPAIGALSCTFYTVGLALQLGVLSGRIAQQALLSAVVGFAAVTAHGIGLWLALAYSPTARTITLIDSISLIAFLSSALVVILALARPVHNLKALIYPVSAVSVIMLLFPGAGSHPGVHLSLAVSWHVGLSIFGYAITFIAALQAALVYFQHAQLKRRVNNRLTRSLPPLLLMEQLLIQMVAAAAVFLGLAIITGFLFADNFFAQKLLHKTVFTIAAWAACVTLLFGRRLWGWRARTAALYTASALGLLMLGFVGTKVVIEYLLV